MRSILSALIFFLLILLGLGIFRIAESSDLANVVKLHEIKSSGQYRWGEGVGADPSKAEDAAMRDLAQKIYVALSTSTGRKVVETNAEFTDTTQVETATYSALQLTGLDKLRFTETGKTRVIAFIDTADLSRSFDLARQKVRDLAAQARQAEDEARIGNALRCYYWAYLTTHTYFGGDPLDLGLGAASDAQAALAEKINRLVTELSAQSDPCYREAGAVQARIQIYHNGNLVRGLDVKYYNGDGNDWAEVADGNAWLTLYFEPTKRRYPLDLGVEYAYPTEMHRRNPEIENLYRILQDKGFDCALKVDLLVPWLPEEPPSPTPPPVPYAPKPFLIPLSRWSVTIQVLSGLQDSREFRRALQDYADMGYLKYAQNQAQLGAGVLLFSALLDEQRVQALLYHDKERLIDTRNGKVYSSLNDAFKGEAYQIWIGEPVK